MEGKIIVETENSIGYFQLEMINNKDLKIEYIFKKIISCKIINMKLLKSKIVESSNHPIYYYLFEENTIVKSEDLNCWMYSEPYFLLTLVYYLLNPKNKMGISYFSRFGKSKKFFLMSEEDEYYINNYVILKDKNNDKFFLFDDRFFPSVCNYNFRKMTKDLLKFENPDPFNFDNI